MLSEKTTRPESAAAPRAFDGYVLERLLGRGAMGEVHLAHDTLLDRPVAIKLIAAGGGDAEARRRFLIEARAVARLEHPNVVSVYRVGEIAGVPYLVSEYVRGTPLDGIERPVRSELASRIAIDLASGLAAAHRRGVLHRDIKPANAIISEDGRVKLLDFGIAKLLEAPSPEAEPARPGGGDRARKGSSPKDRDGRAVRAQGTAGSDEATRGVGEPESEEATRRPSGVMPRQDRDARLDDLTRTGVALGTPRYMAPEVWRGETATFASDVYSLGALLFVLCAGRPVHPARTFEELRALVLEGEAPPLESLAPQVDRRFCRIVDRCLRRAASERFASAVELRAALSELLPGARDAIVPDGNPYRGLACFEAEHRNLYFGRDSETRMVLDRLARDGFVVVAGDSGVGKSSLCRAGVIPRIEGWLDEERRWETVSLVPGRHPVTALAAVLAPVLELEEHALAAAITEDPGGVARSIRARGRDRGLLVLVDQLEELVTIAEGGEACAVAEVLGWLAVPAPGARLLATVRGDFLGRLAQLPRLGELVTRALFFLRPLSPERVHEAIVRPAAAKGVSFASPALVEELVASTAAAGDGALPLLQFALAELWEARGEEAVISAATLEKVGGVGGALCRHADDVLAGMLPEGRRAARRVLTALVSADGTRARRSDRELGGDAARIGPLVHGRILVARDTPEGTSYEIAHEALIARWETLRSWLSSDEEARRARERLASAADDWDRHGRPRDALFGARRIAELTRLGVAPGGAEQEAFLRASRRQLRRARFSRIGAALALPLLLALVGGGVHARSRLALEGRIDGELAEAMAVMREVADRADASAAARARALEAFDAGGDGERLWEEHLASSGELRRLQARAGQILEGALALDASRDDVRAAFADVLLAQARLAEAEHETERLDELLARLAVFDDGVRIAAWNAPADVAFGRPAIVSRYHREGDRLVPVELARGARLSLAPGSYLAVAEDDPSLRLPFVARRGERLTLDLPLAPPTPAGFVYVPAGRFLVGSEADQVQRRDFFHAVPLHEVTTEPYFIARYETTFADWIAFLDALPADERAAHVPRVGQGGFKGSMELVEGDGWRLKMQPTTVGLEAAIGERIAYPERKAQASHDWLRMPVVGITAADAEAYARWLARERVPGARLCTEREWERAARGADGRPYPHGLRLEPSDANHDATYDKRAESMGPDEVGSHPASRSPFGVDDMAGNVWEWTRSTSSPTGHAARGGSWYFGPSSSHAADREETEASFRDVSVGLRICADAPPGASTSSGCRGGLPCGE